MSRVACAQILDEDGGRAVGMAESGHGEHGINRLSVNVHGRVEYQ